MNADAARAAFAAIQAEVDRDNLRYTPINGPTSSMTKAALIEQGQDNVAFAADIQGGLGRIADLAAQGWVALTDAPAPEPTPPPARQFPAPGFYASQRYGQGARAWGNLTIPAGEPKGVLIQVHGGGWLMGDPNVAYVLEESPEEHAAFDAYHGLLSAPFYSLRVMASYAAQRWGVIVWEPAYAYSIGNPDRCLVDVEAAIRWLYGQLAAWNATDLPVVYAGHSAGGQLALRAALNPQMPAPKAFLGMAAAGLSVHQRSDVADAPGGFTQGGTGWIFETAWSRTYSEWPKYAPDSHLADREERFPLYLEQGSLNGRDDGSVLVRWAADFAGAAQRANWPTTLRVQNGVDHYGVRFDQSPTTRSDMDAIWSS